MCIRDRVHVLGLPAGLGEQVLERADGGGGEPVRLLRVLAVGHDAGQRLDAELLGGGRAHQHHGGGAVGDRRRVGGGDGAVLLERRLEMCIRDRNGYDPRDFALVCAGGAAGMHIVALAEEIGSRTVLVPKICLLYTSRCV